MRASSLTTTLEVVVLLFCLAHASFARFERHPYKQRHGKASRLRERPEPRRAREKRIVGGGAVPETVLRRLARVVVKDGGDELASCTGSVAARTYIICAAHCFVDGDAQVDVQNSYVLVGERSSRLRYFESARNKYFIRAVYVHRKYRDDRTFSYDVALIQLVDGIERDLYSPVSLGNPPSNDATKVQAAGYGVKGSRKRQPKRVMQTTVLYQSWSRCKDRRGLLIGNSRTREFCYTSLDFPKKGRTNTCFGDSGGPILHKKKGKYVQVGITSYFVGDLCESAGTVSVAQNIGAFKKMMRRKIRRGHNRGWRKLPSRL